MTQPRKQQHTPPTMLARMDAAAAAAVRAVRAAVQLCVCAAVQLLCVLLAVLLLLGICTVYCVLQVLRCLLFALYRVFCLNRRLFCYLKDSVTRNRL